MSALFQKIAKEVGDRPPYPLYEIPFKFRNENRHINYTLYRNSDGSVGSGSWLKCLGVRPEGFAEWDSCVCCPEPTTVEEIAMLSSVVADVAIPGKAIES